MKQENAIRSLDELERDLGPAAHRYPGALIYEGDCLDLMRRVRGTPIHLTITSPPYNIGKEYERPRDVKDYIAWCGAWVKQIHDITSPAGALWLNLGYLALEGRAKAIPIPYLLWDSVPFYLVQEIVWHYGAGVASSRSFSPRNEKFLWYVKDPANHLFDLEAVRDPNVKYPKQKKRGKLKCNPKGKNPSDVWIVPKVTSGTQRSSKERTAHPAQFPLAVIERIIRACSREGDLILDPFLGSGTVIEAALRNNRRVVGFEIEPKYVRISALRTSRYLKSQHEERAQPPLFRE